MKGNKKTIEVKDFNVATGKKDGSIVANSQSIAQGKNSSSKHLSEDRKKSVLERWQQLSLSPDALEQIIATFEEIGIQLLPKTRKVLSFSEWANKRATFPHVNHVREAISKLLLQHEIKLNSLAAPSLELLNHFNSTDWELVKTSDEPLL